MDSDDDVPTCAWCDADLSPDDDDDEHDSYSVGEDLCSTCKRLETLSRTEGVFSPRSVTNSGHNNGQPIPSTSRGTVSGPQVNTSKTKKRSKRRKKKSKKAAKRTASPPSDHKKGTKKIKKDLNSECAICFEKHVDSLFIPCGHACICNDCAELYEDVNEENLKCPICREESSGIYRIYPA